MAKQGQEPCTPYPTTLASTPPRAAGSQLTSQPTPVPRWFGQQVHIKRSHSCGLWGKPELLLLGSKRKPLFLADMHQLSNGPKYQCNKTVCAQMFPGLASVHPDTPRKHTKDLRPAAPSPSGPRMQLSSTSASRPGTPAEDQGTFGR